MSVLGIRCSNTDISYCVLEGNVKDPTLVCHDHLRYPSDFNESETLKWLFHEITGIAGRYNPSIAAIRRPEFRGVKRTNALDMRIECEGVITLAAVESGCTHIERLLKVSIAKGLGLKKAKYLKDFDTSPIREYTKCGTKEQEAILAAWSML